MYELAVLDSDDKGEFLVDSFSLEIPEGANLPERELGQGDEFVLMEVHLRYNQSFTRYEKASMLALLKNLPSDVDDPYEFALDNSEKYKIYLDNNMTRSAMISEVCYFLFLTNFLKQYTGKKIILRKEFSAYL